MKYEYKRISTYGILDFKEWKDRINKDIYKDSISSKLNQGESFSHTFNMLVSKNIEGFSYAVQLGDKYGCTKEDYLNYYGFQGWKVVASEGEDNFLLMREIDTPVENLDSFKIINYEDLYNQVIDENKRQELEELNNTTESGDSE